MMRWADMGGSSLLRDNVAAAVVVDVVVVLSVDMLAYHGKRFSRHLAFWLGPLRRLHRPFHRTAQPHVAGGTGKGGQRLNLHRASSVSRKCTVCGGIYIIFLNFGRFAYYLPGCNSKGMYDILLSRKPTLPACSGVCVRQALALRANLPALCPVLHCALCAAHH